MNVTRYFFLVLLLSVVFVTSASALPANTVLTVQLMSLSASGQLSPARSISVTTDINGKVEFTFPNVPTSDVVPFLVVRITDGTTILRQSVAAAPAPQGTIHMGISEATTSQATAMIKAFTDSRGTNATLAAMIITMIRSGAISDTDLLNISPLARAAAAAFESFLSANGASGNLPAFRAGLLPAMRDFSAKYQESVDVALLANDVSTANPTLDLQNKAASNQLEAAKRGEASARFLSALVNAGVDAGISPALMHMAFTEAGKAVEALSSPVSADVVTAALAVFRTEAEQCQLLAEMRSYSSALPFMNISSAARLQQFNAAAATLSTALIAAQESFEQIFSDPVFFPTSQSIAFAQDTLNRTLQSLMTNFMAGTTASPGEITAMQTTMAAQMTGVVMSNFSSLRRQGIGSMVTSPTASSQNWLTMMVAGGNFVTPALQLNYSSSVSTLAANFPTLTPPKFSLFSNPYKSLFRLQYDLMLLKFTNQKALAQASQPVTQTSLAQIKENDLARRNTMLQNISISGSGNAANLSNAFLIVMAQPELI
jgi:hypothetical protein